MNADETHKNVSSVPIVINPQIGMMSVNSICRDNLKCLFLVFSSIVFSPGILLKTHKTSHSQYTHSFYQSCLTVIDNGSMYLVEY